MDSPLKNKISLSFLPTPLHILKNLSNEFHGHKLYIKRDDLTGLALGGNKTRKLEYLIYDAIRSDCDTVITAGSQQSNHCRQTAAACAAANLECHLLLGGTKPLVYQGNLLLSELLGAKINFTGKNRKGEDIPQFKSNLESQNKKCYVIPYGGSNETGMLGYVNAMSELKEQLEQSHIKIDFIFFASSSGGTYGGLLMGNEICKTNFELMPINIDKEETDLTAENQILKLVNGCASLLHIKKTFTSEDIKLIRGYDSAGYGILTDDEKKSMELLAKTEGLLLDPVYTARAFHAMLDHIKNQKIKRGSSILFWHTGGIPALFNSEL